MAKNDWRDQVNISLSELRTTHQNLKEKFDEFMDVYDSKIVKIEKILFGNGNSENLINKINMLEYKIYVIEKLIRVFIVVFTFLVSLILYLIKDVLVEFIVKKIL